ncbi:MAG: hypothetical protein JXA99_11795 [Candidatus Lokiarchaeota archaeon]|nr:hypothetical protein [Candidatus Lokiarchaeota archaeon]
MFITDKREFISSPNVAVTDFIEGHILYSINKNDVLEITNNETYEEAVQILKDQGKYDQIMKEVHEACNKY